MGPRPRGGDRDARLPSARRDAGRQQHSDVSGSDGLTAWIAQTARPRAPHLHHRSRLIAQDDLIALRWIATGTYGGGFPGATADIGTPIEFTGVDFLRLVDGRIDEYWVNSDIHVLLARLKVG